MSDSDKPIAVIDPGVPTGDRSVAVHFNSYGRIETAPEKPIAVGVPKLIMVSRRAPTGSSIDAMAPDMAEEAKTLSRLGDVGSLIATEDRRGYRIMVGNHKEMIVDLMFKVQRVLLPAGKHLGYETTKQKSAKGLPQIGYGAEEATGKGLPAIKNTS